MPTDSEMMDWLDRNATVCQDDDVSGRVAMLLQLSGYGETVRELVANAMEEPVDG